MNSIETILKSDSLSSKKDSLDAQEKVELNNALTQATTEMLSQITSEFENTEFTFDTQQGKINITGDMIVYYIAKFARECEERGVPMSQYNGELPLANGQSITIQQGSELMSALQSALIAYSLKTGTKKYDLNYAGGPTQGIDGRFGGATCAACKSFVIENKTSYDAALVAKNKVGYVFTEKQNSNEPIDKTEEISETYVSKNELIIQLAELQTSTEKDIFLKNKYHLIAHDDYKNFTPDEKAGWKRLKDGELKEGDVNLAVYNLKELNQTYAKENNISFVSKEEAMKDPAKYSLILNNDGTLAPAQGHVRADDREENEYNYATGWKRVENPIKGKEDLTEDEKKEKIATLIKKANQAYQGKDYLNAELRYEEVLTLDPKNLEIRGFYYSCLRKNLKHERVISDYKEITKEQRYISSPINEKKRHLFGDVIASYIGDEYTNNIPTVTINPQKYDNGEYIEYDVIQGKMVVGKKHIDMNINANNVQKYKYFDETELARAFMNQLLATTEDIKASASEIKKIAGNNRSPFIVNEGNEIICKGGRSIPMSINTGIFQKEELPNVAIFLNARREANVDKLK